MGISLINCKVDLKLKWFKYCIFSAAVDNVNTRDSNNSFYYNRQKIYVPAVTLSATNNQKLLNKRFERSIYSNKYKKSYNENTANKFRYFLESNFVGISRLFILVYSKQSDAKRFKAKRYFLPKVIIKNYNVITNKNIFMIKQLIRL